MRGLMLALVGLVAPTVPDMPLGRACQPPLPMPVYGCDMTVPRQRSPGTRAKQRWKRRRRTGRA